MVKGGRADHSGQEIGDNRLSDSNSRMASTVAAYQYHRDVATNLHPRGIVYLAMRPGTQQSTHPSGSGNLEDLTYETY